jgi:amino acid transporter
MAPFRILGETIPIVNALMANACCTHREQLEVAHAQECLSDCLVFGKPALVTVAHIVSGGAIFGLMAACFTSLMGQPRILYRMAKDGLWFPIFAKVNPETQVCCVSVDGHATLCYTIDPGTHECLRRLLPNAFQVMTEGIVCTGLVASLLACFFPLEALANLISLGTLMVFTFVDAGVIILRLDNVAKATYESLDHPLDKVEAQRVVHREHQQVVILLLLFTCTLLGASIILSISTLKWPIILLSSVAAICAILIVNTPSAWTTKHHTLSHCHSSFECPCLPIVPLGGVAFNTFMMGSLPLSSWMLCVVWLMCGVSVYFTYGIHHSVLGREASQNSVTVPLMEHPSSASLERGGYESIPNTDLQGRP